MNRALLKDREPLSVMRLAKLEFIRLKRYGAREIVDLNSSVGILAMQIRSLVRIRKRTIADAVQPRPVVFLVRINVVDDDSIYGNYGRSKVRGTKGESKWAEHDVLCDTLSANMIELENDVRHTEKRLYSCASVNRAYLRHNLSALDALAGALDLLRQNIFSAATTPESTFVMCDDIDCDQCVYRHNDCVTDKMKSLSARENINERARP